MTMLTSEQIQAAASDAQDRALAELVAPADRALLHRGYEIADLADRDATMTIIAWVSCQNGAGTGEFRIAPDGTVTGHFESGVPDVVIRP
jgi:hypothetical protein